jgi:hypothetical protein
MKRIITAAILVAALVLPAPAMALVADGAGRTMLSADGWFYEELPDGTIHSIYIGVAKRPGARFGDLWFTESWGVPVVCDNGTRRPSDDWVGYEWTIREGSGRVVLKMNRSLRHALAEGDIPFATYAYSDCNPSVEAIVIGGGSGTPGGGAPADQLPNFVPPVDGPSLHIVLALDGFGRRQRLDVIAPDDTARCPGGPDGARCGTGAGAWRAARGTLALDDILFEVEGSLTRGRGGLQPMPMGAEAGA